MQAVVLQFENDTRVVFLTKKWKEISSFYAWFIYFV